MAYTYSKIASVTVGSGGVGTVNFLAIPQNYTDLVIKVSNRSGSGAAVAYTTYMRLNSLTSSIYSQRALEGNGAAGSSFSQSGADTAVRATIQTGTGATANTFASSEIYIPNYTSSKYKSVSIDTVAETNATTTYMNLIAYLVQTTEAINSITFTPESGISSFAQYSTFTLYGIKAEV